MAGEKKDVDPADYVDPRQQHGRKDPYVYLHVPMNQREIRDDIATKVLVELVRANPKKGELVGYKRELARAAYELADAMMEARQR